MQHGGTPQILLLERYSPFHCGSTNTQRVARVPSYLLAFFFFLKRPAIPPAIFLAAFPTPFTAPLAAPPTAFPTAFPAFPTPFTAALAPFPIAFPTTTTPFLISLYFPAAAFSPIMSVETADASVDPDSLLTTVGGAKNEASAVCGERVNRGGSE
ncbi:unnamed protein product [Closterium sp. NIES-54]